MHPRFTLMKSLNANNHMDKEAYYKAWNSINDYTI